MPKEDIYEAFRDGWHLPVSDLMSRKLITAGEEATVEEVAHLMVKKRINRVPILRGGKLVGIVTREDILHSIQPPNDCEPSSN